MVDLIDYTKLAFDLENQGIAFIPDQTQEIKNKLVAMGYEVCGPYIDEDEYYMQYPYLEITNLL